MAARPPQKKKPAEKPLPPIDQALRLYYAGRPREAGEILVTIVRQNPKDARAWGMLAACHGQLGSFGASLQAVEHALALQPGDPLLLTLRGRALRMLGQTERALASFRAALAAQPDHVTAATGLALLLSALKRHDEGYEVIRPFLEASPVSHQAALAAARLLPARGESARAIAIIRDILSRQDTPPGVRVELGFALGRLLDEEGQYEEAFDAVREAQTLRAARFDPASHRAAVERMIGAMTPSRFASIPAAQPHTADHRPLFIVGMPRSGTTLVERILASHPEVHAGGELDAVTRLISDAQRPMRVPYPGLLQHPQMLLGSVINGMANRYLAALPRPASTSTAHLVTDKMPANVMHLPLIARLFPGCTIIRCLRDPRDTAISCYFHTFGPGISWAGSLEHIASYATDLERAYRHAVDVLGITVTEVRYEDLVRDPEAQSRRLVEAAGLAWDDRCLSPHDLEMDARTQSVEQVNRPIHTESIGRWKDYEAHLGGVPAGAGA